MNLDFLYDVIPGLEEDIEDAVEYEDEGFYYDAVDKWYLILEKYKLATEITLQIYFKVAYLLHLVYEEDVEVEDRDGILRNLISIYGIIIFFNPRDLEARFLRGSCYAEYGEQEKAIRDLDAYISIDKSYFAPYLERGISKSVIGDIEGSLEDLDMAVKLKPSSAEARINRGGRLVDSGKYEEAIRDFEKAIELDCDDIEPYLNKLELLIITEKWSEIPEMLKSCREIMEGYENSIFVFLESVANFVKGGKIPKEKDALFRKIEKGFENDLDWNFKPVKTWIQNTCTIDDKLRGFLIELTDKIANYQ